TPGAGDFYLIEGQDGGNGGAYHLMRATGDLEAWMAVADSRAPSNSQVIMHLRTVEAAGTLELAFGGTGVGFCSAHLKTGADHLYVDGKTNGAPPPGTAMATAGQYCDADRAGCFATAALDTDLGAGDPGCAGIGRGTFAIGVDLDASTDPGANVTPSTIYTFFN